MLLMVNLSENFNDLVLQVFSPITLLIWLSEGMKKMANLNKASPLTLQYPLPSGGKCSLMAEVLITHVNKWE